MKIQNVIIVYDYAFVNGGGAKVAINTAIGLSKQNYNVWYYSAVGPVSDLLVNSKVNTKCLEINDINSGNKIRTLFEGIWNRNVENDFKEFLNRFDNKNTVVHIHGWIKALTPAVIKVANELNFKTFITTHDYFTVCPNGGFYNYKKQEICHLNPMSTKCISCNCDKRSYLQKIWRVIRQKVQNKYIRDNKELTFISVSNFSQGLIKPYLKSNKYYNLQNLSDLSNDPNNVGEDNKKILYVGRLSEEKGIDIFCKAFNKLKEYDLEVQATVIGDGPLLEEYKNEYKNIDFLGWKNKEGIQNAMKYHTILVLASKWYEAAPLTIIEALSSGLPCIVGDETAAVDVIKDGFNGYIFKMGDVDDLFKKMKLALDSDRNKKLRVNIKNSFNKEEYKEESYINKLIEIYNKD